MKEISEKRSFSFLFRHRSLALSISFSRSHFRSLFVWFFRCSVLFQKINSTLLFNISLERRKHYEFFLLLHIFILLFFSSPVESVLLIFLTVALFKNIFLCLEMMRFSSRTSALVNLIIVFRKKIITSLLCVFFYSTSASRHQ